MMRNLLGVTFATSLALAGAATAQDLVDTCPELADPAAYPSNASWMAPLTVLPDSGWILTSSNVDPDLVLSEETVALIAELVRILEQDIGTQLAIVLPPPRGLFVPNADDLDLMRENFLTVVDQLATTGAVVPDILGAITDTPGAAERYFFKTDTHWTPEGALLSARTLAMALEEAGKMPPQPDTPAYVLTGEIEQTSLRGGLLRAVGTICNLDLEGESAGIPVIAPVQSEDTSTALFGDVAPDPVVVLVGTSYSTGRSFRWADAVRFALQQDVDNRAITGGAFDNALVAYAQSDLRADRPALLVWEFLPTYLRPYIGSRMRGVVGSVLGTCDDAVTSDPIPISLSEGEWSEHFPLPEGHDLIQLTLPGVDLGSIRLRVKSDGADEIRGMASQRDRMEGDDRSEDWTFYAAHYTPDGFVAKGGEARFQLQGDVSLAEGFYTTCNAAARSR